MNRILQDQRNCEKTNILIETAEMLQIDTFNVSCFFTWVLLTMIWREITWVFRDNNWQSYEMNNKKNSWQTISMRKNAISC